MASAIFIPPTPSPTDSAESYFFPITITDPTSTPVLNLTLIYFNLHASNQSHQPIRMSSNASINLSNVSPAENQMPLPVRLVKSPEPPMSPSTIATTLAAHPNLNSNILQAITNRLLSTIAQHEAQTTSKVRHLKEQINCLYDCMEHYKNQFKQAPNSYIANDRQIPHFYIPLGNGVHSPAKWVKRLEDGRVTSYHKGQGPNESPYVIDLYAQADTVGHVLCRSGRIPCC